MRQRQTRMARPEEPSDVVYDDRLKASISLYGRDRGPPERHGHGHLTEVGASRGARHAVDGDASPLSGYHRRLLLSCSPYRGKRGEENEARHEAALRFLDDWERGGRRPRLVARLDGTPSSRHSPAFAGGDRWGPWARAYIAMDRWASCVQAVVCFDESAKSWAGRRRGRFPRPGRVGMMCLRLGLERLVLWYAALDKRSRHASSDAPDW